MALQLVIGNKNYSSWSMRPWVLMKALGLPFDEVKLRFDFGPGAPFAAEAAKYSPTGRVPVLMDGGLAVWDSLAICEHLHELFPQAGVWPTERAQRARARSLVAEIHAGFSSLRNYCPMNIEAHLPAIGARLWAEHAALRQDVQRIEAMWADALAHSGGPFLFGAFSAADAMYAPVVMRLRSFSLPVQAATQAYADRLAAHPAVAEWVAEALTEHDFVKEDEPYRDHR